MNSGFCDRGVGVLGNVPTHFRSAAGVVVRENEIGVLIHQIEGPVVEIIQ